jgi:RNA polymerase sigma factor (sigma-70 family)
MTPLEVAQTIKSRSHFTTTRWNVVSLAGGTSATAAHEALEELCAAYWYPLYAYVRRCGYSPPDAEDLTQEFIAFLCHKKALRAADSKRGRFRSFLLASLRHFLCNQWKRQHTLRRGGHARLMSLEAMQAEGRYASEPVDNNHTPAMLYERSWAWQVVERVRQRLRVAFEMMGKGAQFRLLEPFLPGASGTTSYAELSKALGVSEVNARSDVHRFRRRFGMLLREEVAKLVNGEEEIDQELELLISVMGCGE